jgi:hypothetical protein
MPLSNTFCALVAAALLIVYWNDVLEFLKDISNRFGGPPNPMAPLPSADSHLLLKRWRKKSDAL